MPGDYPPGTLRKIQTRGPCVCVGGRGGGVADIYETQLSVQLYILTHTCISLINVLPLILTDIGKIRILANVRNN